MTFYVALNVKVTSRSQQVHTTVKGVAFHSKSWRTVILLFTDIEAP